MSAVTIASCSLPFACAADTDYVTSTPDPAEYFTISSPLTRINSNGAFSFTVHTQVSGNKFSLSKSSTYISASASVKPYNAQYTPNSSLDYDIILVEDSFFAPAKLTISGTTGKSVSGSKSGLDTSKKYYIKVKAYGSDSDNQNYYVSGSGSVSNVGSVY